MRKQPLGLGLFFAVLAVLAGYAVWTIRRGAAEGLGLSSVVPVLPYLLAGSLTVGAVIVVFVWLAGWSERRGYDRRMGSPDK